MSADTGLQVDEIRLFAKDIEATGNDSDLYPSSVGVELRAAATIITVLLNLIESAPHDEECALNEWWEWWEGIQPNPECNCWKSRQLPNSEAGA